MKKIIFLILTFLTLMACLFYFLGSWVAYQSSQSRSPHYSWEKLREFIEAPHGESYDNVIANPGDDCRRNSTCNASAIERVFYSIEEALEEIHKRVFWGALVFSFWIYDLIVH
jgi:hypothetical protein